MNDKLKSIIDKARQESAKGKHDKAFERLRGAIEKSGGDLELFREAIGVSLDGGDSIRAITVLKQALTSLPEARSQLVEFARERVRTMKDPVLAKYLVERAVKDRDLDGAIASVEALPERTVRDLLRRAQMKRTTLSAASRGGHSVSDEAMTNALSELALAARLGMCDDIVELALDMLESHPDELDHLLPFVEVMAQAHPEHGRMRYAHARYLAAANRHADIPRHLVDAVAIDRTLAADALDLLRETTESMGESVPTDDALITILLHDGATERALERLRDRLDGEPESAGALADQIVPWADREDADDALRFFVLDALVAAERIDDVVKRVGAHRDAGLEPRRLFQWFEGLSKEQFLASDLMLLHAEITIEAGETDRAVELLRAASATPGDRPRVLALLERFPEKSDAVDALREEIREPEPSGGTDDGAIEQFENNEFRFSAGDPTDDAFDVETDEDGGQAVLAADEENDRDDDFNIYDGSGILGSTPTPDARDEPEPQPEKPKRQRLERMSLGGNDDAETNEPLLDTDEHGFDESFVDNVANALYESGAATFFHVEPDVPHGPPAEPEVAATAEPQPEADIPVSTNSRDPEPVDAEPAAPDDANVAETEPAAPAPPAPEEAPDFAARFSAFLDGGLSDTDSVDLMETALEEGRLDDLADLLSCSPDDDALLARRHLVEVEYRLMTEHPDTALEVLTELRSLPLDDQQQRSAWLKMVTCHRAVRDLDAAHSVLTDLVERYPDWDEIRSLARQNYREYLETQCQDAPVLEKVTSLDS